MLKHAQVMIIIDNGITLSHKKRATESIVSSAALQVSEYRIQCIPGKRDSLKKPEVMQSMDPNEPTEYGNLISDRRKEGGRRNVRRLPRRYHDPI